MTKYNSYDIVLLNGGIDMILGIIWIACGVIASILNIIDCRIHGEFTLEDLLITLLLFCTGIAGFIMAIMAIIGYCKLYVDFNLVLWKRKEK